MELPDHLMAELAALDGEPPELAVRPVEPLDGRFGRFGARLLYVTGVLTRAECALLVQQMSGQAERLDSALQNRDRTEYHAGELAGWLRDRLEPAIAALSAVRLDSEGCPAVEGGEEKERAPEEIWMSGLVARAEGTWRPSHLNPRLRFCSYQPGGFFRAHCDGQYQQDRECMSLYTCMLYLDDQFEGGATRFLDPGLQLGQVYNSDALPEGAVIAQVRPEPGSCLLFYQPGLLHEGEALQSGAKHILRTEVMFAREPGTAPESSAAEDEALELLKQAQHAESNKDFTAAIGLYKRAFRLDPSLEGCV